MLEYILIFNKTTKLYETKLNMIFAENCSLLQKIVLALSNLISQFLDDKLQYFEIKNYKIEYYKTATEKQFVIISKNNSTRYKDKILDIYAKAMILNDLNIFSEQIEKMMHDDYKL
ncbi:hypothetical protein BDAP_001834 [Binucleata daphniae]